MKGQRKYLEKSDAIGKSSCTVVSDLSLSLSVACRMGDTSKDYHLLQDQYPFAASTPGIQADSSTQITAVPFALTLSAHIKQGHPNPAAEQMQSLYQHLQEDINAPEGRLSSTGSYFNFTLQTLFLLSMHRMSKTQSSCKI